MFDPTGQGVVAMTEISPLSFVLSVLFGRKKPVRVPDWLSA